MAKIRKNFELNEHYAEMLDRLKVICGVRSEVDVVQEALVLLGWAAGEVAKGHAIGAYDESRKVMKEIVSPALEHAREYHVGVTAKAASGN